MTVYSFRNLGKVGRLGNQLFQLSWVFAQAKKNNGTVAFNPLWPYRRVFNVPESFYKDISDDSIDGGSEYYQDLKFFEGYDKEVQQLFQPSHVANNQLNSYVAKFLLVMAECGCSVHHRRTDYVKWPDRFPVCSDKFYISAMGEVLKKEPETVFYVFSDDIETIKVEYTQEPFKRDLVEKRKVVFFDGIVCPIEVVDRIHAPLDWLDLFAQMKCKRHIIANSTFSWWSAFLSGNETYFPGTWFGTHPSCNSIPWRGMIKPDWIEITC